MIGETPGRPAAPVHQPDVEVAAAVAGEHQALAVARQARLAIGRRALRQAAAGAVGERDLAQVGPRRARVEHHAAIGPPIDHHAALRRPQERRGGAVGEALPHQLGRTAGAVAADRQRLRVDHRVGAVPGDRRHQADPVGGVDRGRWSAVDGEQLDLLRRTRVVHEPADRDLRAVGRPSHALFDPAPALRSIAQRRELALATARRVGDHQRGPDPLAVDARAHEHHLTTVGRPVAVAGIGGDLVDLAAEQPDAEQRRAVGPDPGEQHLVAVG